MKRVRLFTALGCLGLLALVVGMQIVANRAYGKDGDWAYWFSPPILSGCWGYWEQSYSKECKNLVDCRPATDGCAAATMTNCPIKAGSTGSGQTMAYEILTSGNIISYGVCGSAAYPKSCHECTPDAGREGKILCAKSQAYHERLENICVTKCWSDWIWLSPSYKCVPYP